MRHFGIGTLVRRCANRTLFSSAILSLAALFAILSAVLVFHRNPRDESIVPPDLKAGQPYAVAVDHEHADFDLNFGPDTRYVVVLGSLGASEGRFEIACSSQMTSVPRKSPADNVVPLSALRTRPPSVGDVSQVPTVESCRDDQPAGRHDVIPVSQSSPVPSAGQSRLFSLHVTDGSLEDPAQYATIHANPIAEGRHVRVYLDDQQSAAGLTPGLVREVVDLFDAEVIPRFRGLLGTYRDVDHDGRFSVLLSPWLSRLQGGRTSIGGFVRGSDFQSHLGRPFGNGCDMMYVNSQTLPGPHLRTLLIHEYAHAVCFSRRTADSSGRPRYPEEEDWLNEGIAHCAESLFQGGWSNLDYRIARFLNEPGAFPLVVGDYYRAGLWRCHGCRGATYLFLRYCVERFGPETLARLVANPAHGTQNVEWATGCTFDRLFRDWTLSLLEAAAAPRVEAKAQSSLALAPLDLYGSLGEWGLAGPRRQVWNVDAVPLEVALRGTSVLYLELRANGAAGRRRLRFLGPLGSRLQVSVIRLPDDSPRLEMAAAWSAHPSAGDQLQAVVRSAGGGDLAIEQIAAEQNAAETRTSIRFSDESLTKLRDGRQTSNGQFTSQGFHLPTSRLSARDVPIVVKAIAADRQGRRVSAWTTVGPPTRPRPESLAQHVH